jgi:hypothetical protein
MKSPITRGKPIQLDDGIYSPLQVMHSAAGYYIGRIFTDKNGMEVPGSRETHYYPTREAAENALLSGNFKFRDCWENERLYNEAKEKKP